MKELLSRYPILNECKDQIELAAQAIIHTYENHGKVMVCGNGGSASDCEHIVGELMKGFIKKRPVTDPAIPESLRNGLQGSLPAISLPSQTSILSAYVNDVSAEMMYAQLVYGYGQENDLLIGISTSGNAKNVVNAVQIAKALGIKTVALTGKSGGKLMEISDITINVPADETFKIQELHLPIYHYLCAATESHFFKD